MAAKTQHKRTVLFSYFLGGNMPSDAEGEWRDAKHSDWLDPRNFRQPPRLLSTYQTNGKRLPELKEFRLGEPQPIPGFVTEALQVVKEVRLQKGMIWSEAYSRFETRNILAVIGSSNRVHLWIVLVSVIPAKLDRGVPEDEQKFTVRVSAPSLDYLAGM